MDWQVREVRNDPDAIQSEIQDMYICHFIKYVLHSMYFYEKPELMNGYVTHSSYAVLVFKEEET